MNGCLICTSPLTRKMPFGYSFNERWIEARHCTACDAIYLHPQPSSEELAALYSREYFEADYRCGHEGSSFDDAALNALVDQGLLDRIKEVQPSGRFLDIGCASGVLLNAARSQGYDVMGVEFSADAARFAQQTFNLDIRIGNLESAALPSEMFHVVYLGDVVEHLPDPVRTMKEIQRILVRRGLLVLACPTQTNTLLSRLGFMVYSLVGKKLEMSIPPYHLFEYRPKSMRYLLELNGFSLFRSTSAIVPPSRIALRGSAVQRFAKKFFQYPNYVVTQLLGTFGDRLEVFAIKAG